MYYPSKLRRIKQVYLSSLCILIVTLLSQAALGVPGRDEWIEVRSKNFFLIGNTSEKEVRRVATKLEQFRETFRSVFSKINLNSPIPTNVVVFKSDSSYKPFKPKRADGKIDNFVAGYFQPGEDVNYITLSAGGNDAETYGTIFHEYVHFIVDTNFGKTDVPAWFNEGLAEYYQTFEIEKDQTAKLGLPQNNHLLLLDRTRMMPLADLLGISNYALQQNGNHSRSIFYAQSWALVHYLIQNGKTEGLGRFLSAVGAKTPADEAFRNAFNMDYAEMEKELRTYVAKNTYQYQKITFKQKLVYDTEMQVKPLSEAASQAYLGDLLYHVNRHDDAEPYLLAALKLDQDLAMANTTLGMVKIRQRKYDDARQFLDKAISADPQNHLALYRMAYLLSREGRDEFGYVSSFPEEQSSRIRELLKQAIQVKPEFTESHELLAFVNLVNNENLEESVQVLRQALRYQPGNQRYQLRIAEILSRMDKLDESLAMANAIASSAQEPEIRTRALDLKTRIDQIRSINARNEQMRKQMDEAAASGRYSGPPRFVERELTPEDKAEVERSQREAHNRSLNAMMRPPEEGEVRFLGNILKIVCKNGSVTYTVKDGDDTFYLTSKDFMGIDLKAFVTVPGLELGCDAKIESVTASLTYRPVSGPGRSNVKGELICVEFVPDTFAYVDANAAPATPDEKSGTQVFTNAATGAGVDRGISELDLEEQRRAMMFRSIRDALRKPQPGEKREVGFLEKTECDRKGSFFFLKTASEVLKLETPVNGQPQIVGFTPEIENVRFGCGMRPLDIQVVFTYVDKPNKKNRSAGELVMLEFVPPSFTLEN
jgi:tetratricopeptide (TPR) repeat protein